MNHKQSLIAKATQNYLAVTKLVEVTFTEEDRENLKTLAHELPKLRSLVEELIETIEILSDKNLMRSIQKSDRDTREGRLQNIKELLNELGLNASNSHLFAIS